ncbi:aminotransferase class I/II-fold pyridoxal phosphate-dependent enzyme [Herbiconiux liukaitaii]|uniref:aminotransferase class I/II-fold pyridoxal phosphate-dependent enzyme n=1 Tax=Herbiconiux liukaitaii TaxID=3342799 RepID=UPI0035B827F5
MGERIAELIEAGELEAGVRLPTVRAFAKAAEASIGTVLATWNVLRERGLIETNRRGGTVVGHDAGGTVATTPPPSPTPFPGWAALDLAQSAPDIALQPELGEALLASLDAKELNIFGREHMTAPLRAAVEPTWPFAAEAWTTAGGGTEALLLATAAAAPPGSLVAVDEPLSPGFLDTLRDLELTPIGVAADDDGPLPAALEQAIIAGAAAFVFQPGAPFAERHGVSGQRAEELAAVLDAADRRVWVIEDDSIGPLAAAEPPSLGARLPHRVIRIRSYCKAYGIDVRTSVIAGAAELVDQSNRLRSFGVGSNSRILQNTLAHLVGSEAARGSVERARAAYSARRGALLEALDAAGAPGRSGPGSLVVWVPVRDETDAVLALARLGIYVGQGSKAFITPQPQAAIRISVTQLPDDARRIRELADAVAEAARGGAREYFD